MPALLLYLLLVALAACGGDAYLPVTGGAPAEERGEETSERSETRPSSPAAAARPRLVRSFVSADGGPRSLTSRAPDRSLRLPRCLRTPMRC